MKAFFTFLILSLCSNFAFPVSNPVYLYPQPDSKYNKTSTSILMKFDKNVPQIFTYKNSVSITGSKSGVHDFTVKISSDNKSVTFIPNEKFSTNEKVQVTIKERNKASGFNFSFETEKQEIKLDIMEILKKENPMSGKSENVVPFVNSRSIIDTLPIDFPEIQITTSNNPSPGYIFFSNFSFGPSNAASYLIIMDNTGAPVYYKRLNSQAYDFKKQPNGNLTYFSQVKEKFFEMNNHYQLKDSFYCGNGYTTDLHELRILNNRHALLMSYDPQIVDMRSIVPNGDSAAIVTGLIIQEIDANKNVVFQWRSWDHFAIDGARHEDLSAHAIDYVHGNAIELDNDGNLLISSRHLDEITKINRNTGAIIWRLGGKYNQFTFPNDSLSFSYQHAIRRLANGNILLFDNGNFRETIDTDNKDEGRAQYSRAVEYTLDEVNRVATVVWQYKRSPDIYGFAMGNAERLKNGNTLICWGSTNPNVTEVNPQGEIVFEMLLTRGTYTYRAFRDDWTVTDIQSATGIEAPSGFNLHQNFPNPFNPVTTIKFDIPEKSGVQMFIYNSIGQMVEEINLGSKNQGSYEYKWNASSYASGIYFYRIKTETFSRSKQMILLK